MGRQVRAEGMARMDPAAIAMPPKNFEHGYVPIVLHQGYDKPGECSDKPPTPTPPKPKPKAKAKAKKTKTQSRSKQNKSQILGWPSCLEYHWRQ